MPCYSIDGVIPVVHPTAHVHPTAVLIGDVIVGPRCYVGPFASLRGDFGRIRLEEGANVQDTCVIHGFPRHDTIVEQDGHIGHGSVLHSCIVRRGALVGMNAVIMDEAEIGEQAFVAACAFVPAAMRVPARTLAAGTPAQVKRELTEKEIAWKAEGTSAYHHLTQRCLASLCETEPLHEIEANRPHLPELSPRPLAEVRRTESGT